jgi:MFS family permease
VLGNLLMGFGIGLYWPSAETMVVDLTTPEQRNEAFAINRLSDSLGLGLGVVLGGVLIKTTGAYRLPFLVDGISFLVLFGVVFWGITETHKPTGAHGAARGWSLALRDRRLITYAIVNVLFTTYLMQLSSTLPLYFTNFVPTGKLGKGFDELTISALFTWHMVLLVVFQLPVIRVLKHLSYVQMLMGSAVFWGVGFVCIWITGIAPTGNLLWAILALAVLAIATVLYMPSASSVVVALAPESLRGVYLAVNSQCWAIGGFIGPLLGGWAMDQPKLIAYSFWLGMALSIGLAIAILHVLGQMLPSEHKVEP